MYNENNNGMQMPNLNNVNGSVPSGPMPMPEAPVAPIAPMPMPEASVAPVAPMPETPVAPVAPMPMPEAPVAPVASMPMPETPVAPAAPVAGNLAETPAEGSVEVKPVSKKAQLIGTIIFVAITLLIIFWVIKRYFILK